MGREHYEQSKKLLLKLHELNVQGKDQTDEADEIREAMDTPARGLTSLERIRLKGLSADLYMLTREEIKEKADGLFDQEKFVISFNTAKWDDALSTLRKDDFPLPEHRIAFLRSVCWMALGDLDVSVLFAKHAAKLMSNHDLYRALVVLLRLDSGETVDPSDIHHAAITLGCFDLEPANQVAAIRKEVSQKISQMVPDSLLKQPA